MPDARFYGAPHPVRITTLCQALGADAPPEVLAGDRLLRGVAGLKDAGPDDLSFLHQDRYLSDLTATRAGAVILSPDHAACAPSGCIPLSTDRPYYAWALALSLFYPKPAPTPGVHPRAMVAPDATIHPSARVEAGAVVEDGAKVAANCVVRSNAVIGQMVELGDGCVVGACATLEYCVIGARAKIHPGARIGSRGFGFTAGPGGAPVDVPQLGLVVVGDDVEIGANTAIDRGSSGDTEIGDHVRIDNLVHIAHNVKIGAGSVIVAMTGIAGSAVLEDKVIVGAQAGITGHVRVGRGAMVAARAGVTKAVPAGRAVGGFPAEPIDLWRRRHALVARLLKRKRVHD